MNLGLFTLLLFVVICGVNAWQYNKASPKVRRQKVREYVIIASVCLVAYFSITIAKPHLAWATEWLYGDYGKAMELIPTDNSSPSIKLP